MTFDPRFLDGLISAADVCKALRIHSNTLLRWRQAGLIEHETRRCRTPYFTRDQFDRIKEVWRIRQPSKASYYGEP